MKSALSSHPPGTKIPLTYQQMSLILYFNGIFHFQQFTTELRFPLPPMYNILSPFEKAVLNRDVSMAKTFKGLRLFSDQNCLQCVQVSSGAHITYQMGTRTSFLGIRQRQEVDHSCLVLIIRMRGTIPHLPTILHGAALNYKQGHIYKLYVMLHC
jgi:hypothetical protein